MVADRLRFQFFYSFSYCMISAQHTDLDYLNIYFQQDMDVLFCRWSTRVDYIQFKEGYHTSLFKARQYRSKFWLQDIRKRHISENDKATWYMEDFLPVLKNAFDQMTYIAYLMTPLQYQVLLQKNPLANQEMILSKCLTLNCFTSEHDALIWLQSYQVKS